MKRLLSLLLAAVLTVAVGTPALAADFTPSVTVTAPTHDRVSTSTVSVGLAVPATHVGNIGVNALLLAQNVTHNVRFAPGAALSLPVDSHLSVGVGEVLRYGSIALKRPAFDTVFTVGVRL